MSLSYIPLNAFDRRFVRTIRLIFLRKYLRRDIGTGLLYILNKNFPILIAIAASRRETVFPRQGRTLPNFCISRTILERRTGADAFVRVTLISIARVAQSLHPRILFTLHSYRAFCLLNTCMRVHPQTWTRWRINRYTRKNVLSGTCWIFSLLRSCFFLWGELNASPFLCMCGFRISFVRRYRISLVGNGIRRVPRVIETLSRSSLIKPLSRVLMCRATLRSRYRRYRLISATTTAVSIALAMRDKRITADISEDNFMFLLCFRYAALECFKNNKFWNNGISFTTYINSLYHFLEWISKQRKISFRRERVEMISIASPGNAASS